VGSTKMAVRTANTVVELILKPAILRWTQGKSSDRLSPSRIKNSTQQACGGDHICHTLPNVLLLLPEWNAQQARKKDNCRPLATPFSHPQHIDKLH